MQPREWRFRIRHILERIERIQRFTANRTFDEFIVDEMAVDAVLRNFEVIGVAVGQIPDDVMARYPDIPWAKMRGMRNVLAHQYEDVRLEIVWDTIHDELPDLVPRLLTLQANETL